MAKNLANWNQNSDSPTLARADLYEILQDLGYGDTGDVSRVTTTGEADKLLKMSDTANTIKHELAIQKTATNAFEVQDDAGTNVFRVDTEQGMCQIYLNSSIEITTIDDYFSTGLTISRNQSNGIISIITENNAESAIFVYSKPGAAHAATVSPLLVDTGSASRGISVYIGTDRIIKIKLTASTGTAQIGVLQM